MQIDQLLQHAIDLIDASNKTEGRELLNQAIQSEPFNPDVWFVYAQYCGKRERAIYALERVLEIEPYYPSARTTLEKIAPTPAQPISTQPAFVALEQDDPWSHSLEPDATTQPIIPDQLPGTKKKSASIPRWFIAVSAGLIGILVVAVLALGLLVLTTRIIPAKASAVSEPTQSAVPNGAIGPIATATLPAYSTPTATPDPCTCAAVGAYMNSHLPRVNLLLNDMNFTTKKLKRKTLKEPDIATLVQNAANLYTDQRAETAPACLDNYQKDAVKMFWTWEQAVTALQNGDKDGALAFIQIITADSQGLDENMTRLSSYPTLQGCNFAFPTLTAPTSRVPDSQIMACAP